MINNFTLFTTAKISLEEYQNILKHIGASRVTAPPPYDACLSRETRLPESEPGFYDARLSRETRHLNMRLMTGEFFNLALMNSVQSEMNEMTRLLGGTPTTAIQLDLTDHRASLNILADIVPYIGQLYRSVVADETGEIRQPEDFVGLAQPGYDGYRWDQTHQQVVKDE